MQSYPNQQDHMYHGPHYYPGMETIPTQGYVNPVRPPMGYGCWPWGSSYGGASPTAFHGCCNHSYFPAHGAWGSPYSHVTAHHCPGNYPSFPVQYTPPPPYYVNMPGEHHCCGCLNHPLHHKEQKNVRIEEEVPERDKRKDCSVVPYEFNSPHPIAWVPPGCSGNKEWGKVDNMVDRKDDSSDVKAYHKGSPYPIVLLPTDYSGNKEQGVVKKTGDMRNDSHDVKANENGKVAAQQPTFQNGWLPLDLNSLVWPKNKGDGEGRQQDDGKRNSPYPLFWMPYKHEEKEKEDQKEKDASVIPSLEMGSDGEQRFHTNRESIGDRAAKKARDIPVKQVEQHVEKETSLNKEKEKDASDVVGKENGEKKVDNGDKVSSKEGSKRKPSPPPKTSKLPPVCLRVDPLPRRKNGNGSSRSPSPASNKQKLDSQSNDASEVLIPSGKKEQAKILSNELKEDKSTKTIKFIDGRTSQGNTMDVKIDNPDKNAMESQADVSTNQELAQKCANNDTVAKGHSEDTGLTGEKNEVSFRAQDMKVDEAEMSCKTRLSKEEAAVTIQSAYRGFDVRRWEPIKKLKQIAEVREQVADVKHLIQAMKSSFDIQGRSKQRNTIAETIMSLLLKLDTIQGLTPSIREVRKSVVSELVSLQEQLDSIMVHDEVENSLGPVSIMAHDEDALNRSEDVITSQNDYETTPIDVLESHQDQTDGGSKNENSETSEADLMGEQESKKIEKKATETCMDKGPTNMEDFDEAFAEKDNTVGSELAELPIGVVDDLCGEDGPNEAHQDETDGGSNNESLETLEADLIGEEASEKIEKEDTDQGVESAPEPTIKEDEKSNEMVINEETIAEKDEEDLVLGQGSAIPMQEDSSSSATTTDHVTVGSELTELPIGVLEEGPNDALAETDVVQEKQQPVGALVESSIISELHETADNKDSSQPHKVPADVPFNIDIVKVEPDTEETCPIKSPLDDKFGTEEEVDGETGDARIEPDDYTVQQKQNFNAHMIEASDAKQESSLISESAKSDEIIDSDSTRQPQITQSCQQDDRVLMNECDMKQPTPTEALGEQEEEQGLKDSIDLTSPGRLSQENVRLRDMMEKLIKSGEEQLSVISSLSERVKDLEKKLSRKKKVKVKQYRAPRSGSSCITKSD